jgi:hypothetical protein
MRVAYCRLPHRTQGTAEDFLLPQPQLVDQRQVAVTIIPGKIPQQAIAPADLHDQPASRVEVMLMAAHVIGQAVDLLGEHRDLHFGRAGILIMARMLLDYAGSFFDRQAHVTTGSDRENNNIGTARLAARKRTTQYNQRRRGGQSTTLRPLVSISPPMLGVMPIVCLHSRIHNAKGKGKSDV